MALHLPASISLARLRPTSCGILASGSGIYPFRVKCVTATETSEKAILRRFANYRPSMWSYDYVQSLTSRYPVESCAERIKKLKEDVTLMLDNGVPMDEDPLHHLELIDTLQRLGVSCHFEVEIKRTLDRVYNNNNGMNYHDKQKRESLYAVALGFRLLRQHGYEVSAEIFSNFRDEKGKSMSWLSDDCEEILALHEAAYLLVEEESDLFHEVINFTTPYLEEHLKHINDEYLSKLVSHTLELPLHWRMLRLEARWFIDVYEKAPDMHPVLLQLAKLDFDIVQATHQEDLKHASRWWTQTGLAEKLYFARDRIIENFLWAMGELPEPQFGYCRRMSTKVNSLITVIDDVYDIYGTIDELELFTDAVDRWDINAMDQLPYYMKLCFHVLHSSINEIAFEALKEQGVHVIPYLKKVWADMCKSFLLEAKWHKSGYIPTFEEYIDNAWISVSGPVILMHAYILTANPVTKEALQFLETYPNIIRWPSMIFRLANDLATSSDEMKRGDAPKAIQCYMHEFGVSEEDTRDHIRDLIAVTWMKMNRDGVGLGNPHLPNTFIRFAMNLARIAQCTYQNGDGHTVQSNSKDRVLSLLIRPVS